MKKISLLIPVYNEGSTLHTLMPRINELIDSVINRGGMNLKSYS